MEQDLSQEKVRRIIISDLVKKRNSIIPVIGEDTIVYKEKDMDKEIPFQEFILNEFQRKYLEQQLKGRIESYKSIWYRLNKENSTLPTRCVYHIFGQAKDGSKWVSDEDLLLTFLLSHNHKEYGATGLTDFLKENEKKLFVLGCNLPNWLFRFLWQPTQAGRNSNQKTTQGYWINKEKPEDSFENFLKKKNFSADEQVKEILVDATKPLQEELAREAEECSSLEASKKQIRVWLQYSCGVTEMLLCPSLGVPFVLLLSPYGDLEMARNGFEGGSKRCAMNNTCSSVNEAGFVGLRTYVQEPMKQCSISWALNHAMKYVII